MLGPPFLRVHRSFIVAAAHIKMLQPEHLMLVEGAYIPIGSSYKAEVIWYFKK